MAEILSQEEIDALLNAVSSGEVVEPAEKAPVDVGPRVVNTYDFRRPDKFSKNQIRTINMIMENFGRSFGTALSAKLRSLVSLQVVSIDQLTYGEFLMSISDPSVIGIFSMPPLEGHAIFEMTTPTAFYVIERLLGNRGAGAMVIRALTEIEEVLISGIISDGLRTLKIALSSVVETNPKLDDLENNPQFVQVVPPQDMVLLTSIEMVVGENSGMIGICFPFVVIEPILNSLTTDFMLARASGEDEELLRKAVKGIVEGVDVDVIAELGRSNFRIEKLLKLEPGHVIPLPTVAGNEIDIYVGGINRPKFKARVGLLGRNNAIQITRVMSQEYSVEIEDEETDIPVEPVEEGTR